MPRVLEVHLQDVSGFRVGGQCRDVQHVDLLATEPPEVGDGKRHRHRASVQVVCVEVGDVRGRSVGVVVWGVWVVRTTVFVRNHGHSAANPALDE